MPKIIPIHYKKLVKIFQLEGFKQPIVIPKYKEIPVFVIKNNLSSAGINRERYFELLKELKKF